MIRRNICAGVALLSVGILALGALPAIADDAPAYTLPSGTPAYIRAAIDDPARTAEQRARDANRKPAELLMMSGIRPGNTVVEFASFGQYFTTFLADIVGPKGKVYMYDLPYTDKRAGDASRAEHIALGHGIARHLARGLRLHEHLAAGDGPAVRRIFGRDVDHAGPAQRIDVGQTAIGHTRDTTASTATAPPRPCP